MESPTPSASAAWRRPFLFRKRPCTVVLDLRPLQCGYAGKGIGRYTYEMARRLGPLLADPQGPLALTLRKGKRPGFRVFSLVLTGKENPLPEIPVKILAPAWKRIWLWDQFFLPFLLARHRVHVFHNFVALGPLPQVSLPGYYRSHVIATLHDWHMFAEDASPVERFYRKTMRIRLQMRDLPKARRVVTDSEKVREETLARGGFAADRMSVVPVGCDHLDAIPAEPWYMENFALSIGDTPNKNLRFAYHVLALLRGRFVHVNWVVVGDRKRVLEQLGDPELGRLPWITILENPTDGLLKSCYQKALCLVFPSTREGFGIPVLEAMRLGCPVVAANTEPMRSLLDYAPGLKNPGNPEDWAEAVKTLLYSPDIRQEHVDHGRKRSSGYTWDAAVNAALAVYPS